MTHPTDGPLREALELLPCPFCGGKAEVIHIGNGPNEGGSCVSCSVCLASSNVEFGRSRDAGSIAGRAQNARPFPQGRGRHGASA